MKFAQELHRPLNDTANFVQMEDKAWEIAAFYEVSHKLKPPPDNGPRGCFEIVDSHPTHWVVLYFACDQANAEENGLAAWYLPRSKLKTLADVVVYLKSPGRFQS